MNELRYIFVDVGFGWWWYVCCDGMVIFEFLLVCKGGGVGWDILVEGWNLS